MKNVNIYFVILLVAFSLDTFRLVDIINENDLLGICISFLVIMLTVPQARGDLLLDSHSSNV